MVLTLLQARGKLDERDFSALRWVLFAGEVFPTKHLRTLMEKLPHPRYANLYGPTETNVCAYYEVEPLSPGRDGADPDRQSLRQYRPHSDWCGWKTRSYD